MKSTDDMQWVEQEYQSAMLVISRSKREKSPNACSNQTAAALLCLSRRHASVVGYANHMFANP